MSPAPQSQNLAISQAESKPDIAQARELFLEYAQALNFSLCFQSFDKELAGLPGDYVPPGGRLLLARYSGETAGCVALHGIDNAICEMKRLYVRPRYRGMRIGFALVERVIAEARTVSYRAMRLDTVEPVMKDAVSMYRRFGFHEIAAYRLNPVPGVLYLELDL